MTHYERARNTGEPTAAAVRHTLRSLVGLVFLTLTLSANAAGGSDTNSKNRKITANYASCLAHLGSDYNVVQGTVSLLTSPSVRNTSMYSKAASAKIRQLPTLFPNRPYKIPTLTLIMRPHLTPRDLTVKRQTSFIDSTIRTHWSRLLLILQR